MTEDSRLSTILVTGGAGFIGSHLCDRLLDDGYKVICLDNFNDFYDPAIKERNIFQARKRANFNLVRGDILDTDLLEKIFAGKVSHEIHDSLLSTEDSRSSSVNEPLPRAITTNAPISGGNEPNKPNKPDVIVHLAALAGVRPSLVSPAQYVDVDIKGTVNLLEVAKEHNVDQFIFGSSSSVYGARQDGPFSEDDPTDAQVSPYATAKKAGELFCRTYANLYGIPATLLRFFTVYGPRQRPEMAIHRFCRLVLKEEPVPMYGDGSSARDYTFVDDVIEGIMGAIRHPVAFEIINLGSGCTVQLTEMVNTLAGVLGIEPRIDRLPEQLGDVPLTNADVSKAKELLDYEVRTSFQEGIQRFVEWMKQEEAP